VAEDRIWRLVPTERPADVAGPDHASRSDFKLRPATDTSVLRPQIPDGFRQTATQELQKSSDGGVG
jgi:hypothetical protein